MRLLPSGELDESFGNAGSTEIDMPSESGSVSLLFDMLVREEGTVVGAGGNPFASQSHGPIIVRLLGAGAGDSPGVLGVTRQGVLVVDEEAGDVVLDVRRTGGAAGHVSVAYQVAGHGQGRAATAGEDFVADAGRLEWDDRDMTPRVIRVRILNDDTPEEFEHVAVPLTDVQGGAGLGTRGAIIEIQANDAPSDGEPELAVASTAAAIGEAGGHVVLTVVRRGAAVGAVSVDYATSSGTATAGTDYVSTSGTLNWPDGDSADKTITVGIRNDTTDESDETFTVTLSNPSAGTALGSNASATVTIADDDAPSGGGQAGSGRRGGGGGLSWSTALWLGLLTLLRRWRGRANFSAA